MKKIFVFIFFICVFCFCFFYIHDASSLEEDVSSLDNEEVKGVFISYIDYAHLKNKSKAEQEKLITEMVNNVSYFGLNSIILQVRSFSDAIYPSDIYLSSKVVVSKEGDPLVLDILDYFIKKAREKNIYIYVWINPYRIRTKDDISDINSKSFYYKWLDTNNIERSKNGIYLNPASLEVVDYITSGVKEICENYDIDGVLYDDYFYPSDTIDLDNYEKSDKSISLDKFRINNINYLLKETYDVIKSVDKDIAFGISPSGNIENNLSKEYLDVASILKDNYIDFIIPQLYYGFNNTVKPYINTLDKWSNLNVNDKDLYVGLSLYKAGKYDEFAGLGENEWIQESDIIKKQIVVSRNEKNYKGFYIFRYEYLFEIFDNYNLNNEIKNLKELIDIDR